MAKSIAKVALILVDFALLPIFVISWPFFRLYCFIGARSLPYSRELLKVLGYYPICNHYYQPLFDHRNLDKSLRDSRSLPGLDFRMDAQLALLEELNHSDELIGHRFDRKINNELQFTLGNGSFEAGDADFLYQIVRHLKPSTIIEIGSGNSTKIANLAVNMNWLETGKKAEHICIEPFEMPWLEKLGVTVHRCRLEKINLNIFDKLGANDLLFIDSSHIIRPQGEVLVEYLEIIPRLRSGVFVHVHDIFSPRDYLDKWIKEHVLFWNEQYLLEAVLSNATRYQVVASLNHLYHTNYDQLKEVCPYLRIDSQPGSFYFKVR